MLKVKKQAIIDFVRANQPVERASIYKGVKVKMGESTIRRLLLEMTPKLIKTHGNGKARRYSISDAYELFVPIDLKAYYNLLPEERNAKKFFNLELIPKVLSKAELFTKEEIEQLNLLHDKYTKNIAPLSSSEYKKELEILAIDLSWKSGEIEGNTYTLLETEALIKYKELAEGKKQEDAIMLLNHKDALDFIIAEPDYLKPLTINRIEDIHSILIKKLGVERNIRKRGVGVGGTEYKPLSMEQQIVEVLQQMCDLVNERNNIFEKALLLLILLSYIQAFNDGNKRTARIISNAILMENGYCPLSYRSVKASDYKKAMLLFYEQNNITEFKKIFINQYKYAVNKYFNLEPKLTE
ncbi:Fic/DOC family protein [Lutibacter sp. Hel_I_33_5]|uniref:Fic family protein n=1 Tax=Lutibacter sp. Hel_I_33_5 TaxID=1566289 RepID=UPI0011A0023A|nr:Fic family protein [Lutibacter sp. Hel_I_33_5]TVZ56839.1 Fic/DOC family protein [Lutibacter sp. Hel_I_33_5]